MSIKSTYYPMLLNLSGRKCIVIGGGIVAERKVCSLLDSGGSVSVIAPSITDCLIGLSQENKITFINRAYEKGDLKGAFLVIAATDSSQVNKSVYEETRELGIMADIVDEPQLCDFIVPSCIRRGPFIITVSTSGKSPCLSKKVRKDLESIYTEAYGTFTSMLGTMRERVQKEIPVREKRKKFWETLVESNIPELLKEGKYREIEELIEDIFSHYKSES
ncbi:MAG: bifunctional precorrin-2 dehydrogenase/sirohydrochlorin ferrochelatase [Candidatus Eremiobacterota bacterium]